MVNLQLKKIKSNSDLDFFRQVSLPITKEDDVKSIYNKMLEILYSSSAVGLSGIMVGLKKRIIVIDLQEHGKKPMVFLNPEILSFSEDKISWKESSVSLGNIEGVINRSKSIKIKYQDIDFNEKIIDIDGYLAVCFQHEFDYLDGKLFIDYLENKDDIINSIVGMKVKNVIEDLDVLRKKCSPVEKIDNNILDILNNMLQVMYDTKGVGLTANQVGIDKQLIVIDLQENGDKKPIFLINPKILEFSKEIIISKDEGCLSVPNTRADVPRYKEVKVEYLDRDGKVNVIEADGLLSICLQHEIDHINGKLFIDYLSKLKREILLKKVKKYIG